MRNRWSVGSEYQPSLLTLGLSEPHPISLQPFWLGIVFRGQIWEWDSKEKEKKKKKKKKNSVAIEQMMKDGKKVGGSRGQDVEGNVCGGSISTQVDSKYFSRN